MQSLAQCYGRTYSALEISHFPNHLDQLPHLQVRVRLQDQCDIAIVAAGNGRCVTAECAHGAQDANGMCGAGTAAAGGMEGVQVGGENARSLEGHFGSWMGAGVRLSGLGELRSSTRVQG